MKTIQTILAVVFGVTMSYSVAAETQYSLQVNGASFHSEKYRRNGEKFNELNTGIGVQVTFPAVEGSQLFMHLTAGTLKNSVMDTTAYAGCIFTKRWGETFQIETGLSLGVVSYPSSEEKYYVAIAPVLSFGVRQVGVNVLFAPAFEDSPSFVFMQLRLGI